MAAEWRKILISGSNAHIAAITASTMGAVSEDTEVVFRKDSTGRFYSSGSTFNVKYTSSDGGQLYLDNLGLTAYNISASGIPDLVQDNSQMLFWDPNTGGIKATSSVFFDTDNNQIEFVDGVFSGSFTGDGSQLTGVIGTLANPLTNAQGIISSSGEDFEYDGTQGVIVQVNTASNGGLDFTNGGLHLVDTLAGSGLYFPSASTNNYSTMSVDLDQNSGLSTGSGDSTSKLKLSDSLPGNGLEYDNANSVMQVKLATNSGLTSGPGGIALANSLAGTGLSWANIYDELEIDSTYVVTQSNYIVFNTGSSNLTLTGGAMTTASANGYQAYLIDNPEFTYDLNDTLSGDFTFNNDVIVKGDFTISGSLVTASIETDNLNIADQFILLNSGSSTGDGGFTVSTSATQGGYLFYNSSSARWGVSSPVNYGDTHDVNSTDHAALVTVQISNSNESTILASTPLFGTDDSDRQGQLVITTAAATNESSIYIYA